jgi:hypothetical protein
MNKVYLQYWEESESGWGVRPDGCSLHIELVHHMAFINKIYESRDLNNIPYEYDRVVGNPIQVIVSDDIFNQIKKNGNLRLSQVSFSNLRKLNEIKIIYDDEPFV